MKLSIGQLMSVVSSYVASAKISVDSFSATYDNSVGLLDKIAKTFTIETPIVDKLEIFNGEDLPLGKTLEEWQSDLILPEAYDSTGANALAPHDSTYRPVSFSFTLGRKKIPQTIRNDDIERAVNNVGEFERIIVDKTRRLYDSERLFNYGMKREAVGVLASRCVAAHTAGSADLTLAAESTSISSNVAVNDIVYITATTSFYVCVKPIASTDGLTGATAISGGYLIKLDLVEVLAKPVDSTTGEAFIKSLKSAVEIASDNSEGHSLNGNTLGATSEEGLVLLVKQGVWPSLEVDTMAGAFHLDKLSPKVEVIALPDFGSADSSIYAVLLDRRGVRLHNSYRAVRENMNGDGDFLNLFFHTENTVHCSRNTYVRVYKAS